MDVAILKNGALDYCRKAPFHPPERFPEYPFTDIDQGNECYRAVRDLLFRARMDPDNFGTPAWNPLGEIIRPGDRVFIKPNFVSHQNKAGGTEAIVTHGSVLRALLDYASIALRGRGQVTIGDAPYIDTDFSAVLRATGVDAVAAYYRDHSPLDISVIDLRQERGPLAHGRIRREALAGDPLGYTAVDLGPGSAHAGLEGSADRYRVAFYDRGETRRHHTGGKHEYLIANSVLAADVVLNIPKLKTHGKTGMTCALKNMVGINGRKGWLPHHLSGPAERGGDEYCFSDPRKDLLAAIKDELPALRSPLPVFPLRAVQAALFVSGKVLPFRDGFEAGGWHGNDTLPRTIADLNAILFYADRQGILRPAPQRRAFAVVDGIVAGEGDGPMTNDAKRCGVLIAGSSPVAVDIVAATAMGFDHRKIPTIKYALGADKYPLFQGEPEHIRIAGDRLLALDDLFREYNCGLVPARGWAGHIEREPAAAPAPRPVPATRPGRQPAHR